MGYLLYQFSQMYGWKAFVAYYFIPYVVRHLILSLMRYTYRSSLNLAVQPLVRISRSNISLISAFCLLVYLDACKYAGSVSFGCSASITKALLFIHCSVLVTFLHHSDPTIPHFRKDAWSFLRGAAGTVDRPTLGWIGRFFFHNVCSQRCVCRIG